MAIDKRKTLDSARRYAQRGAREKSLAQYEALLRGDPRDFKLRLEIGDVHQRWGRTEDAVAHYARVAQQFRQEGFEARAVAVWKRVLNLDPKFTDGHVALSELYQQLGMQSQSIESLQSAIDGLNRDGQKREALELLRRMGELDPTNTASRLKVAELLLREGMKADAVNEFEEVAREFERIEAIEAVSGVYQRILEVTPDCSKSRLKLGRAQFQIGESDSAERVLTEIRDAEPEYEPASELLSEIYAAQGRMAEVSDIRRRLANVYRNRGDEEQAREMIQRLPVEEGRVPGAEGEGALDGSELDFGTDDIESLGRGDFDVSGEEAFLEVDEDGPENPDVSNFDFDGLPGDEREVEGADAALGDEAVAPAFREDHGLDWGENPVADFSLESEERPRIEIELEAREPGVGGAVESPEPVFGIERSDLEGDVDQTQGSMDSDALPVAEELEEASFYVQQELYDEAETILRRVLDRAPGHPTALVRLGEIAAMRGEDPGRVDEPHLDAETSGEGHVFAEAPFADGSFDLASELREEMASSATRSFAPSDGEVRSVVDGGMSEIFADFKRGVAETLSASDIETRYDLGIAYREMGLFEDAIEEFRACLEFVERRVDSLQMLSLCCVDSGRTEDAVAYLEQALADPGLSDEQRDGLNFDLGGVCERLGDTERARSVYRAIRNADFPGLGERLATLEGGLGSDVSTDPLVARADSSAGYESFDDLWTDGEVDAPPEEGACQVEDRGESWVSGETPADVEAARRRRARKISFA